MLRHQCRPHLYFSKLVSLNLGQKVQTGIKNFFHFLNVADFRLKRLFRGCSQSWIRNGDFEKFESKIRNISKIEKGF